MNTSISTRAAFLCLVLAGGAHGQGADSCANAPVVPTGSSAVPFDTRSCSDTGTFATTGPHGSCSLSNDVWFRYRAGSTGTLVLSTCGTSWDTEIGVYSGASCASLLALGCNDDSCTLQSQVSVPCEAGEVYFLQVGDYHAVGAVHGPGTLWISETPARCGGPDDGLEPNDDCDESEPLADGTYAGLFVTKTDWDYYLVALDPGGTLTVDLVFNHASGDIDMFLYDASACLPFAFGNIGPAGALTSGFTSTDGESLVWTNSGSELRTYALKVNLWPPFVGSDCNHYDLAVQGTSMGVGPVGATLCSPPVPNSGGARASIRAWGSAAVGDDLVLLLVEGLPPSQFGIFVNGRAATFVPLAGGSQGNLCIGGGVGRYVAPGELQFSEDGAGFRLALELGATPTPAGFTAIQPGETWFFQAWYRDANPGTTSNFSDAVSISFL